PYPISTLFPYTTLFRSIAQEEVFGPVAPVITVDDEKEAIRIANDSKFGLGASIWTQDLEKAQALSSLVQSGIVTVNNVVVSDPRSEEHTSELQSLAYLV